MDQPLWSFELFGFRVQVWATFLVLALVLAYLSPLNDPLVMIGFIGLVFVSLVVHELGHAFVARRFGLRVGSIQLRGLGAQVASDRTSNANQIAISLAGPGAGLLLALVVYGVWRLLPVSLPSGALQLVQSAVYLNVVWSIFNLIPVLPLDGGNALRAGLGMIMPNHQAWTYSAIATMAICAVGAVLAIQQGEVFLALFGAWFAYRGYQIYKVYA